MIHVYPSGELHLNSKIFQCALGKNNVVAANQKQEGDGATPDGIYSLRAVYYRADKIEKPLTQLSISEIKPNDGWCDDPADLDYNKKVKLPYEARHESLWRDDDVYDVIVEIGYNDAPVVPGKGSCIFIHVAKPDYAPTEGCVALKKEDLLQVLALCDANAKIHIHSA